MPNAPKKINRPWVPERIPFKSFNDNSDFYNSHSWRKAAKAHKLKNPVCIKCEEKGIVTAVTVTDHIVRIVDGGAEYDENNLQSLCRSCHSRKSGKEAHGYREKKKETTKPVKSNDKDLIKKKETFYISYCNEKGWVQNKLTYEQISEIKSQEGWKNP